MNYRFRSAKAAVATGGKMISWRLCGEQQISFNLFHFVQSNAVLMLFSALVGIWLLVEVHSAQSKYYNPWKSEYCKIEKKSCRGPHIGCQSNGVSVVICRVRNQAIQNDRLSSKTESKPTTLFERLQSDSNEVLGEFHPSKAQ